MSTNPKKAPAQESLEMSEAEDTQKTVSPAVAVTDIAEYRPHEEQIVRLETTYAKLVVDCSTSEGLANAKEVRVDIRDVRYALANTTKTALVPYQQTVKEAQARVNQVKEFGETLRARVLVLEEPIDEAIKAEEKRVADAKAEKERLEQQRIEAIKTKINRFRNVAPEYASRSSADIAKVLASVKESVILPEEYAEFEAEGTIARDNAIDQLETLHTSATQRETAVQQLAEQKRQLDELREQQRVKDEKAQKERDDREAEDRKRLKDQQDALDRERKLLDQQKEEQRLRDEQNRKDQLELAQLRAAAANPAPITAVAAQIVASSAAEQVAALVVDTPPTTSPTTTTEADGETSSAPPADDIVEVVALGFDVDLVTARAWLRAISF